MKKLVFYKCDICGNVSVKLMDSGVKIMCCGKPMAELNALAQDGAVEKHKPVVNLDGKKVLVKVGEVPHPMTPEHYISFIAIETDKGFAVHSLTPEDEPKTEFTLAENETLLATYAYCNLHSLWK